jgi:hypothetical protein
MSEHVLSTGDINDESLVLRSEKVKISNSNQPQKFKPSVLFAIGTFWQIHFSVK